MDEYISKTKFEELMRKKARNNFDLYYADKSKHYHDNAIGYNTAADEAYVFPSADVQPVKHGRWETWGYVFHGIEWKRCSVCGKTADVSYRALLEGRIEPATLNLCGCCGARMDLKDGDIE